MFVLNFLVYKDYFVIKKVCEMFVLELSGKQKLLRLTIKLALFIELKMLNM